MSIFTPGTESKEESRRTIIAVVLSTLIVGVGFMVQNALFPPVQQTQPVQTTQTTESQPVAAPQSSVQPAAVPAISAQTAEPAPVAQATYKIETNLLKVELTNAGGDIVSLKLKKHKDNKDFVDLIVPGASGAKGLSLSFGGADAPVISDFMKAEWLDAERRTIAFTRTFMAKSADSDELVPFTYKKVFSFRDDEYMFGLAVTLENSTNKAVPLNVNGVAYTLQMGPQIGPRFDQLPKNADYRKYIMEVNGKKKIEMPKPNTMQVIKEQPSWAAMAGKYFAFIGIPQAPFATFSFYQGQDPDINQTNTMFISRPAITASVQTDTYYFYFGPKTSTELAKYEYSDKNSFGLASMKLEDATERSNILGWLEAILKFMLNIFYKIIPNYGIAIILVTIVIKIIFFPLTKKGSISTAKMQELQPKVAELQAKYKSNPQKLNQEMAEFYKRENYNPMSGCLPMLIQFPLFIAMYSLFNNHFDLRGASFIPGWISDLSLPESILNFGSFRLPLLGWSDLRALPIIYLASQLLYGKFTQTPQSGQNASQMKLMMYGMPIMFFFILYDVPSGLLIYWIVSNVLTIVQQVVINDMLKKHKLALAEAGNGSTGTAAAGNAKSGNGQSMKNAGKTTVRNGPQEGFSQKVTKWLEDKAKEAGADTSKPGKPGDKPKSGKKQ